MRRIPGFFLIGLLGASLCGASGPKQPAKATAKTSIERAYSRLAAAWKAMNGKAVYQILDEYTTRDFVRVGLDRKPVKRDGVLRADRAKAWAAKSVPEFKIIVESFQPQGNTVIATARQISRRMLKISGNKTQEREMMRIQKDTWVKSGSDWKWKRSDILREIELIDGKAQAQRTLPGVRDGVRKPWQRPNDP